MTARFVVAYGGDSRSRDALVLAADVARSVGAEIDVVLVVRTDDPFGAPYPPVGDVGPLTEEQARGWLADARDAVGGDVVVRTHLRRDRSIAQGVLDAAAELGASLVVVGTASGGPAAAFTVGPVATHLLHASPVPVLLTPPGYRSAGTLRAVYCAVGTRPGAQLVVDEAVRTALRAEVPLHLVSLVDVDEHHGAGAEARRRAEDLVRRTAEAVTADPRTTPDTVVTIEIGQGRSMRHAIDSVTWEPGSLLLVGSSRLAAGRRTFLGTTAARMLRHLPVPMVVVPRPADAHATDAAGGAA